MTNFRIGDRVVVDNNSPTNQDWKPSKLPQSGTVTEVGTLPRDRNPCQAIRVDHGEHLYYADRYKLDPIKENTVNKQYTYNQIVEEIIGYKSSASPAVRRELINLVTQETSSRGRSVVPNSCIVQAVKKLSGVCDEGKDKFLRHLGIQSVPDEVFVVFRFKPEKAASMSDNEIREFLIDMKRQMSEGLGTGVNAAGVDVLPIVPGYGTNSSWSKIAGALHGQ